MEKSSITELRKKIKEKKNLLKLAQKRKLFCQMKKPKPKKVIQVTPMIGKEASPPTRSKESSPLLKERILQSRTVELTKQGEVPKRR